MIPRPYQASCIASTCGQFSRMIAALCVLPTGTGKTVIFAHVIKKFLEHGRAMVIAHRAELLYQASEKIFAVTGVRPDIEMAEMKAREGSMFTSPIVLSSIQTQNAGRKERRMERFDPNEFSLLVIDEAHHATADSYRRMIDYYRQNPNLRVMGVTATPDRTDEAALGQIFDGVAYEYQLVDAILDGWLVPISQQFVDVKGLDFSQCKTTAGDLNAADLARVMEYEHNLHGVIDPVIKIVEDRKTLLFAASVEHADRMREIIDRHKGGAARLITGETPKNERRDMLRDYEEGKFQFLCNVGVATEGFDMPDVEVVVMARPTKSRSLFAQMLGRGTRPLTGLVDGLRNSDERRAAIAASAKPEILIVDFVGNSGRHKLIHSTDILGGRFDDHVVDLAAKIAEESEEPGEVLEALQEAEAKIKAERRAEVEEQRKMIKGDAVFSIRSIDPFVAFDIVPQRIPGWDVSRLASEAQVAMLKRNGVPDPEKLHRTHASQIIDQIIKNSHRIEATPKQRGFLRFHRVWEDGMSKAEASKRIGKIKAGGR